MPNVPSNEGRTLEEVRKTLFPNYESEENPSDDRTEQPSKVRRFAKQRSDADVEPRLQNGFKVSVLHAVVFTAIFVYFGLAVFTWDSALVKPDEREILKLRRLLKKVYKSLPTVMTFERFRHYLLHHPAAQQRYCVELTAIVCETFLATMPSNVTYQDFLANPDRWVLDFPYTNRSEVTLWEWQPMIEPFEMVSLQYNFTDGDISEIRACIRAVSAIRNGDDVASNLSSESAKYFSVGACRLAQLATFRKRADMLWQLCMVGCGTEVREDQPDEIAWSTICDAFLFMLPDLRALHQCQHFPEAASTCNSVQWRAFDWCGLGLLLEEVDDNVEPDDQTTTTTTTPTTTTATTVTPTTTQPIVTPRSSARPSSINRRSTARPTRARSRKRSSPHHRHPIRHTTPSSKFNPSKRHTHRRRRPPPIVR